MTKRSVLPFAVVALALAAAHAEAAPPVASVTAVYDARACETTPCGSGDAKVAKNAIVDGAIEVHWRATSDTGLEFVRLETQVDGTGPWWCVQRWEPTGSREATDAYRWETQRWPELNLAWRCSDDTDPDHKHGEATPNGTYRFRILARTLTGEQSTSSSFAVRINNAPVRPAWASDPSGSKPPVTLRWFGNLEPDLVMYRLDRTRPGGGVDTVLIDPAPQASSGCRIEDGPFLVCDDARFGGRKSGTYRYTLAAVRRAVSGDPCRGLPACLSSQPSEPRSVKLTLPSSGSGATPLPSKSAAAALPSAIGSNPAAAVSRPPVTGVTPTQDPQKMAAGGARATSSRALPLAIAALLLAVAGAALVLDFKRWSRRGSGSSSEAS